MSVKHIYKIFVFLSFLFVCTCVFSKTGSGKKVQQTSIPSNNLQYSKTAEVSATTDASIPIITQVPSEVQSDKTESVEIFPQEITTSEPTDKATMQQKSLQDWVGELHKEGLIHSISGQYVKLDDFDEKWAQRGWFQWWSTGYRPKNFVLRGNASWESDKADTRPETAYSGCGIVFRATSQKHFYVVYIGLDGEAHLYVFNGKRQAEMTRGRYGQSEFSGNATYMLVVENDWFTFYVNDKQVIRSSAQTHDEGEIALTLLSGTNSGFGTHCKMTNMELWTLDEEITSNKTITLPYKEDFNDEYPDGWQTYDDGWKIGKEGKNRFWLAGGSSGYPQAWLDPGTAVWRDYAFESRIRFNTDSQIYICARADNKGESFYSAYLDSEKDYLSIIDYNNKPSNDDDYLVFGENEFELQCGIWYNVRFEVEADQLRLYIDNELVSSAERSSYNQGGVGFYMEAGNDIALDDIFIWSLEP